MKLLVLVSLITFTSAEADADALYLSHPSSFNSYYSPSSYYTPSAYYSRQAPLLRAIPPRVHQVSVLPPRPLVVAKAASPVAKTIPAVPVPVAKTIPAVPVPVAKTISAEPVPVAKTIPAVPVPVAKTIPAVPVPVAKAASPVAKIIPAGSSVVSTQYHAQDEDKNFSFGYSNINSARHEAGNAYTGVVGSYTDGRSTVQYVADALGYRHL